MAFIAKNPVMGTEFRVKVLPLLPLFTKTTLSKIDESSKLFEQYQSKFTHDIRSYPTFKVVLFDKYDNSVTQFPENFPLRLYFANPNLNIVERFEFCKSGKWIFVMCD
jgi:hypothetical protein